jgi:hypothetical protein
MSDTLKRLFREGTSLCFVVSLLPTRPTSGALYAALLSCVNAANTALLQSNLSNNALLVPISFVLQSCVAPAYL